MAVASEAFGDQRKHKRYSVSGIAKLQSQKYKVLGELVAVSQGGLLAYCDLRPAIGEQITVYFSVSGLNEEHHTINAHGKIAWSQPPKLGVEFLEQPLGLPVLTRLLENKESTALSEPQPVFH